MKSTEILICPVCKKALLREEKSYFCCGEKRHCFDISASGHVNLFPGRATGGDDKKAVRSRTEFLNLGYYQPIADKVSEILSYLNGDCSVIDAGCGDGYYTNRLASSTGAWTYGFDLSKEAIISASKSAKKQGIDNSVFCVGGIYELPVADESADAITNIFAPCAEEEFTRVLKPNGLLIEVTAGKNHLYGSRFWAAPTHREKRQTTGSPEPSTAPHPDGDCRSPEAARSESAPLLSPADLLPGCRPPECRVCPKPPYKPVRCWKQTAARSRYLPA